MGGISALIKEALREDKHLGTRKGLPPEHDQAVALILDFPSVPPSHHTLLSDTKLSPSFLAVWLLKTFGLVSPPPGTFGRQEACLCPFGSRLFPWGLRSSRCSVKEQTFFKIEAQMKMILYLAGRDRSSETGILCWVPFYVAVWSPRIQCSKRKQIDQSSEPGELRPSRLHGTAAETPGEPVSRATFQTISACPGFSYRLLCN